jgi:hypothetical protein
MGLADIEVNRVFECLLPCKMFQQKPNLPRVVLSLACVKFLALPEDGWFSLLLSGLVVTF